MRVLSLLIFLLFCFQTSISQINCFVYHRFGDTRYPSTNISTDVFEQQLAWLKKNQYEVITLSEAIHLIKSGELEGKKAVITIDDAYTSFLKNGFPLLKKYGYPATLFVNTENIGQKDYLTWNELIKLNSGGVEIGNHTHSHSYFLEIPASERAKVFKEDIEKAKKLLIDKMHLEPKIFAYPFGEHDNAMKAVVKELGFEAAAAQNSGVFGFTSDLYSIPRFPMGGSYATLAGFKEKLNMDVLDVEILQGDEQIFSINPPVLKVKVLDSDIQWNTLSCFIAGKKQQGAIKREGNIITIQSANPTKARRTLYTLTVQSKKGTWLWFSHVWVNSKVPD